MSEDKSDRAFTWALVSGLVGWLAGLSFGAWLDMPALPIAVVQVEQPERAVCWLEEGREYLICYPEEGP